MDPDKDIEITVEGRRLQVLANHREEADTIDDGIWRREVHYGYFARTMLLPEGVDERDVNASYRGGTLEVRLPLPAPAESEPVHKRVPVVVAN